MNLHSLRHLGFLAISGIRAQPRRWIALGLSLAFAFFLPTFSALATSTTALALRDRAAASPLLVGAPGDTLSLALQALYFRGKPAPTLPFSALRHPSLHDPERALAVPLYLGQHAGGASLVGTNLDYFDIRQLRIAEGRRPARLGEVVAGAWIADKLGLHVGDSLPSDLEQIYDLSGPYPLMLEVVGIFAPNGGPDDGALFTDLKTSWAIRGDFHGHAEPEGEALARATVNAQGQTHLQANPSLMVYQETDSSHLADFHLHGSTAELPISAILVFPRTSRDHDLLLGELDADPRGLQVSRPPRVIEDLLAILERAERGLRAVFTLVLLCTSALTATTLYLSWESRRKEHQLFERLGCAAGTLRGLFAIELLFLLTSALLTAGVATGLGLAWVEGILRS